MATLQQMYRCYKSGEEHPEFLKYQDVDLKKAEEDVAQDRCACLWPILQSFINASADWLSNLVMKYRD